MSRWRYDTDHPPPQAFEAVEAFVTLLRASGLLGPPEYLGATDRVYAFEEPAARPSRWVRVAEFQEAGGRLVSGSGLLTVRLHVKVACGALPNAARWHAAMHARIARAVIGQTAEMERSEVGWRFRQLTEPSRPEYYEDTDTRESFAMYSVTLQPKV